MSPKDPNPLLSKNIPPPPPNNNERVANKNVPDSAVVEQPGQATPTKATTKKPVGDLAKVELSLYLKPAQDDKLEDLRRAYKRHTGKKISANEVMRRLIERASLETLL